MTTSQHPFELAEQSSAHMAAESKEEEIPATIRSARFKDAIMSKKDLDAYEEFWGDPCWAQDPI